MKTPLKFMTLSTLTVAIGMALAPLSLHAQEQLEGQQEEMDVEVIKVTGSRIARDGSDAPTPVTVLGKEEFTLSGTQNVEELLLDSPQFTGNQLEGPKSNTVQAGSPIGVSTLNLRNFGANRNLVLVNGRRFAITGPAMTTDINTIPAALIERTEIVTGGSSAVYGSDAITGVVNFVMKDNFEGVEVNVQSSWDQPSSSPSYNIDLTFGGNFDEGKGNMTASLGYLNRAGFTTNQIADIAFPGLSDGCVTADSWSNSSAGMSLDPGGQSCEAAGGRLGFVTGGSSSVPNGRIGNLPTVGSSGNAAMDAALIAAGLQNMTGLGAIFDQQGNAVRPFISPDDRFDFNDNSFVLAPQERWMGNVFANYDLNDDTKAYLEMHYSGNVTSVQIAPPNVGENFLFDVDNPYLSAEMQTILSLLDSNETGTTNVTPGSLMMTTEPNDGLAILNYGRRFNDLGGRYAEADHNVFRTVVGINGVLPNVSSDVLYDLSYDVYYSYAKTSETDLQTGSVSKSAVQRSLLSQNGNAPLLNLFGNGNITEAAEQAIAIRAVS
jgi:outer membrane receptor protein involved in Fe transport